MSVYFAQRAEGGLIKIGCSCSPALRCKQLSSDLRADIVVLASADGAFRDEGRLHRQFAQHRVDGEWFEPAPAVLDAIEHIRRRGKLPPTPPSDRDMVLARRYLGGETLESIAADFSITRERVRQILRATGIPSLGMREEHKRKAAPISDEERAVAQRYLDGETLSSLSVAYPHLSVASVLVRTNAIGNKQNGERTQQMAAEVVAAYEDGLSPRAIADRFGFAHATYVYRWLETAGHKPSRRGGLDRGQLERQLPQVLKAWERGEPMKDIAASVGASLTGLQNLLKRHSGSLSPAVRESRRQQGERNRVAAVVAANKRRFAA